MVSVQRLALDVLTALHDCQTALVLAGLNQMVQ